MADSNKSLPTHATELWELVVAYFKQETLDPVKALGRFLLWGVAGSAMLCVGLTLLVLGLLRALQAETGESLTGNLTWVPYGVTLVVSAVVAALAARAIGAARRKREARG